MGGALGVPALHVEAKVSGAYAAVFGPVIGLGRDLGPRPPRGPDKWSGRGAMFGAGAASFCLHAAAFAGVTMWGAALLVAPPSVEVIPVTFVDASRMAPAPWHAAAVADETARVETEDVPSKAEIDDAVPPGDVPPVAEQADIASRETVASAALPPAVPRPRAARRPASPQLGGGAGLAAQPEYRGVGLDNRPPDKVVVRRTWA